MQAVEPAPAQAGMWSWYHFNWLSGDQTAQQLIHSLDKSSWALGDKPPQRVYGLSGRYPTAMQGKAEYEKWLT